MSLWQWSRTASSNATADPTINFSEGMSPSSVNDSCRAMMAAVASYRDDVAGSLTTGGTTTAYTVTSNQVFDTLAHLSGNTLTLRFNATNGAAPTLDVDGLAAAPLQTSQGVAVPTGMLIANSIWRVTYDNSIPAFLMSGVPAVFPATTFGGLITVTANGITISAGVITLPAGTVGAPSLTWPGSNDGFYQIDANNLGLSINGTLLVDYAPGAVAITGTLSAVGISSSNGLTISAGAVSVPAGAIANAALATPTALVKISVQTLSGAQSAIQFTGIDNTYRGYVFEVDYANPTANNSQFLIEVSTDGGSTYKTTLYNSTFIAAGGAGVAASQSTTGVPLSGGSFSNVAAISAGWSGRVELHNPSSTTSSKTLNYQGGYTSAGAETVTVSGSGIWNGGNTAINAIQFRYVGTTIATNAKITMYGMT